MLMFPKPRKKTKTLKDRKKLNARRKFKAHGSNPLKIYRRRFTNLQVEIRAEICRQQHLASSTEAELAFEEILVALGVTFEREKFFQNGDRWVHLDFYLTEHRLAIEVDGRAHDGKRGYDDGRDQWLLDKHRIKTIRFTNETVLRHPEEVRETLRAVYLDGAKCQ